MCSSEALQKLLDLVPNEKLALVCCQLEKRNGWLVCFFETAKFCPELLSILPYLTFTEVQQSFFFSPPVKPARLLRESSTLMSFEKVFLKVIYGKAFCMFM